ncbi:Peptidoglycan-binding Lysin subgroup [Penicillium sp. IBT 18751x]|nr:Peptidoglycan-binding Lysin subgroup [Penicillium sp. IBT 18751x]
MPAPLGNAACDPQKPEIVNNEYAPNKFLHFDYYEVFNLKRACLNLDVTEINGTSLTHGHFAFTGLTADFDIALTMMEMKRTYKKVLSFGGWAGSTDAATFQRYRDVFKPRNRDKYATNKVAFFKKYNYAEATDIPGVPPGTGDETNTYLTFLKLMKSKLPTGI